MLEEIFEKQVEMARLEGQIAANEELIKNAKLEISKLKRRIELLCSNTQL